MSDNEKIALIEKRLELLESQMIFLFKEMGITPPGTQRVNASPEIVELIKKGDIIEAIKAYRNETGASLKDAKTFIESLKGSKNS